MQSINSATSRVISSAKVRPTLIGLKGIALGIGIVGSAAFGFKACGIADTFLLFPYHNDSRHLSSRVFDFFTMLGRTLFVPGLTEEVFWRVALTPNPIADGSRGFSKLRLVLLLNTMFALYHLIPVLGAEKLGWMIPPGAPTVFSDPSFLALAFVLGNACSFSYHVSFYGLYAPVLVHAVTVAFWLDACGGEKVLRGES
mmetsp:Transcript_15889/g.23372  ORF Transcript_15889/g.23372 Transcript_15889/m.23372 type:complete len:199 (-) Transcript_15889:117-713(-)